MKQIFKRSKKEKIDLNRPVLPALVLLFVIVIGTIGYSIIWSNTNSSIIDELYMTIITITTVGFQEIYPLDTAGRIFTMFIAIFGIGSLFYVLSVIMENLVIIQFYNLRGKRKMEKKIENLSNHIILVGHGRVGQIVAKELIKKKMEFVIICDKLENESDKFDLKKLLLIEGDATEDSVLLKANIKNARGIIIAIANPATTVFVVLSAKVLNPGIFIVARADEDSAVAKLKKAGADKTVNPYTIGGQRLANVIINPNVIEFLDTGFLIGQGALTIENILIPDNSICHDKTIMDLEIRKKSGANIVAVIRDGNPFFNPDGNFKLLQDDQLVAMGTREQMQNLEKLLLGRKE